MKKNGLLFLLLVLVLTFAYFFIFKKEESIVNKNQKPLLDIEKIKGIKLTSEYAEVQLELKEGVWWVIKPELYLGQQELIEKALMSMTKLDPLDQFQFSEDRFGFKSPQAFIEFIYQDEQRIRLTVGSVLAPGQNLYVFNKDSQDVYVYHNVWGQFFYYPVKEFFHQSLPIIGQQVKKIEYYVNEKKTWSIESKGLKELKLTYKGLAYVMEKAKFLWFFNQLREFKISNLDFTQKNKDQKYNEKMLIETEKGNIIFQFNDKTAKIFIPSLNVFADYHTSSLTSLSAELEKVISSE